MEISHISLVMDRVAGKDVFYDSFIMPSLKCLSEGILVYRCMLII